PLPSRSSVVNSAFPALGFTDFSAEGAILTRAPRRLRGGLYSLRSKLPPACQAALKPSLRSLWSFFPRPANHPPPPGRNRPQATHGTRTHRAQPVAPPYSKMPCFLTSFAARADPQSVPLLLDKPDVVRDVVHGSAQQLLECTWSALVVNSDPLPGFGR